MTKQDNFLPEWSEEAPAEGSYRSIFKWGDPLGFKHPNNKLYALLKEEFCLTDADFAQTVNEGNRKVTTDSKVELASEHIEALEKIVTPRNVAVDDYSRVRFSHGKAMEETILLRQEKTLKVTDAVVHPRDKKEVAQIVEYCNEQKIPIYVYGGGSSVVLGLTPTKGGVTLVLSTHMNKIIELNEDNHTVTVQPGMMGPAYEEMLNNAPKTLNASRNYTCGHFPQSFEYSTVGGWVVTLGSGQQSSYYGDAGDLVVSQEYITPAGSFKTLDYAATATGPKVNDIMKGSEGSFGILVEVTMKVFRYMPETRQRFSFIFPSFDAAVNATREVSQGEFGMPSAFRISDEEETDVGLKLYGVEGTVIDTMMQARGYRPGERCLMIGMADGEKGFAKNVKKNVSRICKANGAMSLTGYATKKWEHGRYLDPYMREDLQDYGVVIDTLESGVTWSNIHRLHQEVRKVVKSRPQTVCMVHASHFYPQGTNLYFIFIAKIRDLAEYKEFQDKIIDAIVEKGGSCSHHHGVGKMLGPWMEKHLGPEQMDILRALKRHFDPNNIMNPGGQLGLDLAEEQKRK
jgi:alkyldihydroxyacetonephosphate synthase